MDFSLQSGNQISLKRDEKQSVLSFMTRKVNGDIDYLNIVLMAISFAFILVAAALYFYNASLASKVDAKKAELNTMQSALKDLPIDQIKPLYTQLKYVNNFTKNYSYSETIFVILGKTIENNVQYNSFKYNKDKNGIINLEISGAADSYKALAQQMNTYYAKEQQKFFKNLKLKGFSLDKRTGKISFVIVTNLSSIGVLPDSTDLLNLGTLDGETSKTTP
jgi:hypothetical protein